MSKFSPVNEARVAFRQATIAISRKDDQAAIGYMNRVGAMVSDLRTCRGEDFYRQPGTESLILAEDLAVTARRAFTEGEDAAARAILVAAVAALGTLPYEVLHGDWS